jgi:hypothetical protein
LRYPSARAPGTANLAIIVDRLQRESVLRINPSDGFARQQFSNSMAPVSRSQVHTVDGARYVPCAS